MLASTSSSASSTSQTPRRSRSCEIRFGRASNQKAGSRSLRPQPESPNSALQRVRMKALSRLVTIVVLGISGVNALALELPLPFDTELGRLYRNEIDSLLVPADRLPSECPLAHDMTSAPIFPATTNPFVTDNPQLIGFVAAIRFPNITIYHGRVAPTALHVYQPPRLRVRRAGGPIGQHQAAPAVVQA